MTLSVILLGCAVLTVTAIFGAPPPESANAGQNTGKWIGVVHPYIIGGEHVNAPIQYQVSLRVQKQVGNLSPTSLIHFCGGTFVVSRDNNIVVTAAHCLQPPYTDYLQRQRLYVVAGTRLLNYDLSDTFISPVVMAETHPRYNITPQANDVAVLKLKDGTSAKPNVGNIPLASRPAEAGHKCNISGWGVTNYGENQPPSNILKSACVPVLDIADCRKNYKDIHINIITDDMMCAGYEHGGTDTCQGDSGGPLVCDGELAGVVSWGFQCAVAHVPGVYANVHYQRKWIQQTIQKFQRSLSSPNVHRASTDFSMYAILLTVLFTYASTLL